MIDDVLGVDAAAFFLSVLSLAGPCRSRIFRLSRAQICFQKASMSTREHAARFLKMLSHGIVLKTEMSKKSTTAVNDWVKWPFFHLDGPFIFSGVMKDQWKNSFREKKVGATLQKMDN